ncbi:MAG: type II toxin-antitoxin system RelE/ParE family toxin [Magnetococcales bacterium]|nr:type II toxin-antitoxin system RelE/ParE family toxin [Magnetococcales bacterium]
MKLRFTTSAQAEFFAVINYIRQENPMAAQEYFLRAKRVLRRLEQFPESGRYLPEFPDLPHREIIVRPYRFVYRVMGTTVWVVTVWHGARQPIRPAS